MTNNNENDMILTVGGVSLHISSESASDIDTGNIRRLDQNLNNLLEAAREVKRQNLFGNVDVDALTKAYSFVPFKYQKENVKVMLNRFEGRGVFGDQVGLGKTVEALMTAHAMFQSGTIKNALLIVPEKTKSGWIEEINEKFPNVFTVHDVVRNPVNELNAIIFAMDEMAKLKQSSDNNNHVFIITDSVFKNNIVSLYNELIGINTYPYDRPLSDRDKARFKKFEQALNKIVEKPSYLSGSSVDKVKKLFEDYGYNNDKKPFMLLSGNLLTAEKLIKTIDLLESIKNRLNKSRYDLFEKKNKDLFISCLDGYIKEFKNLKDFYDNKYKNISDDNLRNIFSTTLSPVADPTIDLMIVDEIHSFYESDKDTATALRTTRSGDKTTVMDIFARIEKKFCILLSATPIRTTLEDIFDLVYLVDSKRFGKTKREAREYFYNQLCRVSPDTPNPLSEIFNEDNEYGRNNFLGLVNNFFTRKRINKTYADMNGVANGDLPSYEELKKAIGEDLLQSLENDIITYRELMYRHSPYSQENAKKYANEDFKSWKAKIDFAGDPPKRHMRSSIDAAIIERLGKNDHNKIDDPDERQKAYSAVNWNRRKKSGIAFFVDDASLPANCDKRSEKATLLTDYLYLAQDDPNKLSKYFIFSSDEKLTREQKITDIVRPFLGSLCYDSTLCYLGTSNVLNAYNRRMFGKKIAKQYKLDQKIDHDSTEHNVVFDDPESTNITTKNYNQVVIANEQLQAGVNFQKYRNLVFAHMDLYGERLLEPVDIEQWIGRIHRTGQLKSCRIVTVLTTVMNDQARDPSQDFLKWYYGILSDPNGLDLYGNSTPDIAFLQPIIVDTLRARLCKLDDQTVRNICGHTRLIKTGVFSQYNFAELLEFCFYLDQQLYENDKINVQELIKDLCKIPEFGKYGSEN